MHCQHRVLVTLITSFLPSHFLRFLSLSLPHRYPTSTPATHPLPHVISKIESVEALVNFDSILEVSDAIMVARGEN